MNEDSENSIKAFDEDSNLKTKAQECLKKYFGFDDFRSSQYEVISEILKSHNTLAIMPTGKGKSLCYQLPALMLDGVTCVVSPLIALMKDQVDALKEKGREGRVMIDLGLVNQAEYYSSLVFKGYSDDMGIPVLSGGRYDNLLADFGDDIPAAGFGLDRSHRYP